MTTIAKSKPLTLLAALAPLVIGGVAFWLNRPQGDARVGQPATVSPLPAVVTALGRIEPHGEVIHLSAPSLALEGARIARLLVEEGTRVRTSQIIAVLDREERLTAALRQAQRQVDVAQARLAQVRAGAKGGELDAQRAAIARLEAELRIAKAEHRRYQYLQETGAVSASQLNDKRLVVETIRGQLNQARSVLTGIAEVRPTDVRAAEADVASAAAAVDKARTDLHTAYVRAPQPGQILKIHTRPGETVDSGAIVDIGATAQMDVVAEVYEDDLPRIRVGQRASVTSLNRAFPGVLGGTVYRIIPLIGKRDVLDTDPAADVDARVAEVKIRLDGGDSRRVEALTNLKVQAAIAP